MNRDRVRCNRCRKYDHFVAKCPNTPTDEEMEHSDVEPASLQMLMQENIPINSNGEVECLKPVKGKDSTTSFLPIGSKTGGKIIYIKNKEAICLSEKQANYVYKKVEEGNVINTKTMKHEIEQEVDRKDNNPYQQMILNKVYKKGR